MEAFDNWLEQDFYPDESFEDGDWFVAERAWKAALEWVKQEAISLDKCGDISRSLYIINKELEN